MMSLLFLVAASAELDALNQAVARCDRGLANPAFSSEAGQRSTFLLDTYRGLVKVLPNAETVRNFTQCDSLLLGDKCGAHTVPYIEVKNPTATIEHEATTSKISEDQLFYAMSRGLDQEAAVALIVNGFAREVLKQLPMEFAVEAQKLLGISLEGSVG
jgi:Fe-S cluster assembly protein SufB